MLAYQASSPLRTTPLRRRASGLTLALAINLVLLLILLTLGRGLERRPKLGEDALVVDLIAGARSESRAEEPNEAVRTPPKTEAKPPLPKPKIVLPVKPSLAPPSEKPWIEMSKAEMAAADVRNLPKVAAGSGAGDSEEVGRGPNGEVLYAAEWARRPTNTELGGYLPRNAPEGWGQIACRTVSGNRVEDCIEMGQSPRGSRLASAVRQAAWQFRVRPPRKNGRPLVGSWVQIRITYEGVTRTE